ncbi:MULTISPECIES: NAD(P)/FAD-dependent oxidoreductase [Mediterraneibacter]|uniref:NAD(P)/FAD-dependent oxidoreductase n=1 Tax=Mediterraneibacter TaxID=2316020 RepID=UPI000E4F68CD|nr:NAD(P)/FAD-dependent oxidoreductase [Mediterraneibacter massiliensis]RGT73087.1 FAD/NAD(P)-binding oxidoreductase [Ruminococcus sp. AF18-22]
MYDVVIIGAGVIGSAAARELSRYQAKVCVLEKEEDVCSGTSKANSGIVHAGFDAMPGTLMAKLNVQGNKMMEELSQELDFPFKKIGSLVVCTDEADRERLSELYLRGVKNKVENLRIVEREELVKMEPNISDDAVCALYAPDAGVVCPFGLTIALAENAHVNGVEFYFRQEVEKIEKNGEVWRLWTRTGEEYKTKYIVNAAGVYADRFHNMVSRKKIHITPRKGEYILYDKEVGRHVTHTIFALPGAYGKGILVTPTVHGNLLSGPTAVDISDREGTDTTREGLAAVREKARITVKGIPAKKVITSFAGLRAHEDGHEFLIGEVKDAPGFIDCAGIESPGLTSAPAIGKMIAEILRNKLDSKENIKFQKTRKSIQTTENMSLEERNVLIRENPAYGNIICRCEGISEGEILDAIHRPLGAKSLDGIKRRTRAGMGRCQAGFCTPKVMEILTRELSCPWEKVTKKGGNSKMVLGENDGKL